MVHYGPPEYVVESLCNTETFTPEKKQNKTKQNKKQTKTKQKQKKTRVKACLLAGKSSHANVMGNEIPSFFGSIFTDI